MQSGPGGLKGNMIAGPNLESLIGDFLSAELHFDESRAAARAVVEHFRERNFILCFVGADSYAFVHRTFLEYFCAGRLCASLQCCQELERTRIGRPFLIATAATTTGEKSCA